MRILNTGMEVEAAVADALVRSQSHKSASILTPHWAYYLFIYLVKHVIRFYVSL